MPTGVLGSPFADLGDLTLGAAAVLGDTVERTPGLLVLYRCDDPAGQSTLAEVHGKNATVTLGSTPTPYTAGSPGVDDFAIGTPSAVPPGSPPPYTRDDTPHLQFAYSGADIDVGNAGTIELWFRPSEFGTPLDISGGITTTADPYEVFRLTSSDSRVIRIVTATNNDFTGFAIYSYIDIEANPGITAGGTIPLGFTGAAPAYYNFDPSLASVPAEPDRWFYLAITWDQTNVAVFTNGQPTDYLPTGFTPGPAFNGASLSFGGCGGLYDLVSVTAGRMTPAQIAGRYHLGVETIPATSDVRMTSFLVSYAATYDSEARVTHTIVQALRTGARSARITGERVSVLRSVDTTVIDTGSVSQTLAFTQTAAAYVPIVHNVVVSQTLAFTQSLVRDRLASIAQSLTFTETVTPSVVHPVSQTLAFTETVSVAMVRNRSLLQLLPFTETNVEGHNANLGVTQTLVFSDVGNVGHLIVSELLQLLPFTETSVGFHLLSDQNTDTLVFTQTAVGHAITPKHVSVSDLLVFSESATEVLPGQIAGDNVLVFIETVRLEQIHVQHVKDTLVFHDTLVQDPGVHVQSVTQTLSFYDGTYQVQYPITIGGQPVVITRPVATILAVTPTVILKSATGVIVLPSPEFNDSEATYDKVNIRRTMVGGFYSYVQTSNVTTLKYNFILGRQKALELRAFIQTNLSVLITLTNWKAEVYVGQFTTNPFPLSTAGRYANAYEKVAAGFEFEGVKS